MVRAFPLSTFHTEVMKVESVGHFWTAGNVQKGLHLFMNGAPGPSMSPCAKDKAKREHISSYVDKFKKTPSGEDPDVRLRLLMAVFINEVPGATPA